MRMVVSTCWIFWAFGFEGIVHWDTMFHLWVKDEAKVAKDENSMAYERDYLDSEQWRTLAFRSSG